MKKAFKAFLPIAASIEKLLYPHAEVVIHDIQKNQIAAIYNPISKRKIGDSSLLSAEEEMSSLQDWQGPYEKINWDGRKLKAVSSMIRDEQGKAVGLLCINLDVSTLQQWQAAIAEFMTVSHLHGQPRALFKDDWQERIHNYIHHYLGERHLALTGLNRSQKKALVLHLHKIGALTAKNSAQYVADIIKVSRATIYNYLQEI